jgi:hypothetical protein
MQFTINNRFTQKAQFTCELDDSFKDKSLGQQKAAAVKKAIESSADLRSADLRSADLRSANLRSANLSFANLSSADLSSANLSFANLSSANLRSANLSSANLRSANLRSIKEDFLAKLLLAKSEAGGLYDFIMRGKVDGSCYEGECACFVGSIANICGEDYEDLSSGLEPDSGSPVERWFFGINKGDTPQNNQVSAITAEWMREFMSEHSIVIPEYKLISSLEYPQAFEVK